MRFSYRDDQIAIREAVRDFARARIVPNAEKWSEGGKFPLELLPELAQLGLLGLAVPADLGGAGLDVLTIAPDGVVLRWDDPAAFVPHAVLGPLAPP